MINLLKDHGPKNFCIIVVSIVLIKLIMFKEDSREIEKECNGL